MRTIQSWTCELGYGADTMFHETYFLFINTFIFTAGRHASGVYAVTLCPSVCPSFRVSQVGVLSKLLNASPCMPIRQLSHSNEV